MTLYFYYSHSAKDYNDEIESQCIEKIKKSEYYLKYSNNNSIEIINPRFIEVPEKYKKITNKKNKYESLDNLRFQMTDLYFPRINKCKALFVFPYHKTGNNMRGVQMEIEYANESGIDVIKMNFDGIDLSKIIYNNTNKINEFIEIVENNIYTKYPIFGYTDKLRRMYTFNDATCLSISQQDILNDNNINKFNYDRALDKIREKIDIIIVNFYEKISNKIIFENPINRKYINIDYIEDINEFRTYKLTIIDNNFKCIIKYNKGKIIEYTEELEPIINSITEILKLSGEWE